MTHFDIGGENNPLSLLDNPLERRFIPPYPSYDIRRATGTESTFEIDPKSEVAQAPFSWQGFSYKVPVIKRPAQMGEVLRMANLKHSTSLRENLAYRIGINTKAATDKAYQEFLRQACRSDILFFVNTFVYTFDPRLPPGKQKVPFVTYPFQDDVITWQLGLIKHVQTGVIEKSRDMGASWMFIAVGAYLILFYPMIVEYWMSLREEDVDNREMGSLLEKLRFILRELPVWLRGGWKQGDQGYDMKMKVKIPDTESVVQGQLTRGTAGRSGRATRVVSDEGAFIEDLKRVSASQSSLTDSQLHLSTPNGMGNHFYTMACAPNANKKTLHWSLHPLKNDQWAKLDRSKVSYTDETWSQEQEISYETSTRGRVFPQFTTFSANEFEWKHAQTGDYFRYDPAYDVIAALDFGIGDPTSAVFAQLKPAPMHFEGKTPYCLVFFDEEERADKDVDWWADFLVGKGYKYSALIGDARTGNQRDAKGKTWFKYLAQRGLEFNGKYSGEEETLIKMRKMLHHQGRCCINANSCDHLIKSFQNWSFAVDSDGMVREGAKPKHDQWSHAMKASLYLVDWVFDDELQKRGAGSQLVDSWKFRKVTRFGI